MLASRSNLCKCVYKWNLYDSYTAVSVVLEFLLSLVLIILGLLVNFKFKPIMRWYQIVAMALWTYILLFFWLWSHEILPSEWFTNCWLLNIATNTIRIGRSVIAYNSFFTALIRYLYIVHHERAHLWEFDKVGRIFQLMSISLPILMEILRLFTEEDVFFNNGGLKSSHRFLNCLALSEGWNDTTTIVPPKPITLELTLMVLPSTLVDALYYGWLVITTLIYSNTFEGYLYFKIFQTIKR